MRMIGRRFVSLVFLSLAIPALAGYLVSGTLVGAGDRAALGWAGAHLLRPPHHLERQLRLPLPRHPPFETDDRSTNVFWLALPSLGESWHHNHHAFPRSAVHGLKRWELDPSALVIGTMEKLGLARNVVRISPERQAERTV